MAGGSTSLTRLMVILFHGHGDFKLLPSFADCNASSSVQRHLMQQLPELSKRMLQRDHLRSHLLAAPSDATLRVYITHPSGAELSNSSIQPSQRTHMFARP